MSVGKKSGNIVVWVLIVMLVVGLGGFGVSNFGGTIDSIGTVGDEDITVDDYSRELQRELRAQEAATGAPMTVAAAEQLGIVTAVRGQVIAAATLDYETRRLGLSVGDAAVAEQVVGIDAFKGLDGTFDRDGYTFALEQAGMTEEQFETGIRKETARNLLQGAVISGVPAPDAYTDALYGFIAERRSYKMIELTAAALDGPVAAPTDAQVQAYYDENAASFTAPESKQITFAWLSPEMVIDSIDVDEDALRALYDERIAEYVTPERRLVERLVFGTQDVADAAHARLTSGEITFDALVAEIGLSLSDVDMGDVGRNDLSTAAADAVFAADAADLTGVVVSNLGPAIFRINAILPAQETSFDEVRDDLKAELAVDRARRVIADQITDIDDRLAAGATLEELTQETEMQLGQIAYFTGAEDDIAGYEAFRAAASAVSKRDFPEVTELEDGGIFALRLNDVTPPTLRPLDEVRAQVTDGWTAGETARLLVEKAKGMEALLIAGDAIETLGLPVETAEGLTRGAISPADLSEPLFALTTGAATIIDTPQAVYLLQLTEVLAPDSEDAAAEFLRGTLAQQAAQGIAQDIYGYFAESLLGTAGLTLDQSAINAVHAQFP